MRPRLAGGARWRPQRVPGQMNLTERRFEAAVLRVLQAAGEIAGYQFEAVKFRIGTGWDATYLPDFMVFRASGEIEMIDVKGSGGWEDKARVKIKACARLYPEFHWLGWRETKRKGVFDVEVF